MNNRKPDLLSITPVESYTPPEIPTFSDSGNGELLKKLPSRWQRNAKVVLDIGPILLL